MRTRSFRPVSSQALRAEVSFRNLSSADNLLREVSYGRIPSVLYAADEDGGHGNFLLASYRRIRAHAPWAARLDKVYTASARLPRATDRWRGELEYAGSSDALLMNVFCYPGVLRRPSVCSLLGVPLGLRPDFGLRAGLPMHRDEIDRTELDMVLGPLIVEAKLTESGFGHATLNRLMRYKAVQEHFHLHELPCTPQGCAGYQLVRGLLAAHRWEGRYMVLLDARRPDLAELCFRVLQSARSAELRSRFQLLTWQELAAVLPQALKTFLLQRYGIVSAN